MEILLNNAVCLPLAERCVRKHCEQSLEPPHHAFNVALLYVARERNNVKRACALDVKNGRHKRIYERVFHLVVRVFQKVHAELAVVALYGKIAGLVKKRNRIRIVVPVVLKLLRGRLRK